MSKRPRQTIFRGRLGVALAAEKAAERNKHVQRPAQRTSVFVSGSLYAVIQEEPALPSA